MTPADPYWSAVGGAMAGLSMGFVPLIVGLIMKERSLGGLGFLLCSCLGPLGGLLLAAPAALISSGAIVVVSIRRRGRWQ
jgi:hypothetical protein